MNYTRFCGLAAAVCVVAVAQETCLAQTNLPLRTPAAIYFAGRSNAYQSNQPQPIATGREYASAGAQPSASNEKPFEDVQYGPTLSPYLALDLLESSTGLPNYTMFVQPRLQQQMQAEAQARELQQLRRQARVAAARGSVTKNPVAGVPTTGSSLQFMNVGGYFPKSL